MAAEEWRLCVDWLVRCKILPPEHRATHTDAQAFDLAQALRDGVLICHLLNYLSAGSVHPKDFTPRPQMSQFLCLKNIRTFLQSCKRIFQLRESDLFEPADLFEVSDFKKVLSTFSKLSKTDLAQKKVSGFPPNVNVRQSRYRDDDEDIYGNLKDLAEQNDLDDNESLYDTVYQDDDEIYDDLCRIKKSTTAISSLPAPKSKRDHCVKELLDTERNYKDALKMIVNDFIIPLQTVLSPEDKETIFQNIEPLLEVHTGFYSDLHRACTTGTPEISEAFIRWKSKFLCYGQFCSHLPKAQDVIEEVCRRSEEIKRHIEDCERRAKEGKFKLRDLLSVPMQRVLKYHLLLRELIKHTDKTSEQRKGLEKALETMQDLSLYVNEVKRDNEAVQLISEIQNSIVDLQMPENTTLKDYGRLQRDGELRVRSHKDGKRESLRYIFLFDKVMLMCKSRGEAYNFKEAISLSDYRIEESSLQNQLKKSDKWGWTFNMVEKKNQNVYSFSAKTEDMKRKWIEAIKLALENTSPAGGLGYTMHTFDKPKECDVCGKLLRGIFFQGYISPDNKKSVHKECIGKTPLDAAPAIPPRFIRAKAKCDYRGTPSPGSLGPALLFVIGDVIDVSSQASPWWKGTFNGEEGYFPSQLVEEMKVKRNPSYIDSTPLMNKPLSPRNGPNGSFKRQTSASGYQGSVDLLQYPWFVNLMEREEAVKELTPHPNGTFLIRESPNPSRQGGLSLSIKYSDAVRHIKVVKTQDGTYYLADCKHFRTVVDLVEYYQKNSLRPSFPEVDTTLLIPVKKLKKLGFGIAVYDYAATATTQLNLRKGDRVAILSKTGSDRGWWKGQHLESGKVGYFPLTYVQEEDDDD